MVVKAVLFKIKVIRYFYYDSFVSGIVIFIIFVMLFYVENAVAGYFC